MREFNGKVTVVCGEYSGEIHAANLVNRLSSLMRAHFYALGGPLLKKEGAELIFGYEEISLTGSVEILRKIFSILRAYALVVRHIKKVRPSLVILVDFPGFNLRVAKIAKMEGLPVVYYIPPQLWAWGKGRINKIKAFVDLVLCLFPFEKKMYDEYGIRCEFVGHPFVKNTKPIYERERFFFEFGIKDTYPIIAILPGSRKMEVKKHMPFLCAIMEEIEKKFDDAFFLIAKAYGIKNQEIETHIRAKSNVRMVDNFSRDVLFYSDCAILSSGSSTLEAAILGVPSVVIYRLSYISYLIGRLLVKVPFISLPNIILGEEIFPEFVQDLDPKKIAVAIMHMLEKDKKEEMKKKSQILIEMLGCTFGDPYLAAATCIYNFLMEKYGSLPKAS